MIHRLNRPWVHILILLAIQALTLIFIPTRGTPDMGFWLKWTNSISQHGLIEGYGASGTDNAPLIFVIFNWALKGSGDWLLPLDYMLKWLLYVATFLTALTLYFTTRNFPVTVISHLSLVVGSVSLAYLDIFALLPLVIGLWGIKRKRYGLGLFLISLSCLIKFLPLIIAPSLAIYLWRMRQIRPVTLIPSIVLAAMTTGAFGWYTLTAFQLALRHSAFSAQALNLNWIVTYALNFLSHGAILPVEMVSVPEAALLPSKLMFFAVYAYILWMGRWDSFAGLIESASLGYLAYFMINTGVHENHLLTGIVLFGQWATQEPQRILKFLIVCLFTNFNMIYFYGLDGTHSLAAQLPGLDLFVAIIMVAWFGKLLWDHRTARADGLTAPADA